SNAHAWHGLANTQAALGDHAKAVLSFRKALRLKPNDEVAQVNLGNSLKSLGEIDKAANAYQNAVRLAPDYGPAYYNLAGLRQVQGRPDAAVELYQETIRLQPTLPEAYFALGKLCHAESRMHEAILAYQSVLQLDLPNHLRAQANVKGAEVLAREGREAEAMAMLDAAVSAAPDFPAPFAARAAVAIQQGDYATAARGFNQALSLATDPEQQRHFRLQATIAAAQAHMEAGRPGAAIKLYEELLAEHPRNPQLHLALGTACSTAAAQLSSASPGEGEVSSAARAEHAAREERLFERATEAFQFALKLQPNHAPTYRNIGRLLRAQREYNGALAAFKRAVKLVPDAASWFDMGIAHYEVGDLAESIACYRRSLALQPHDVRAHANLGSMLHEAGEHEAARSSFRLAAQLDPSNEQVLLNWGHTFRDTDQPRAAQQLYMRARQVAPDNMQVLQALWQSRVTLYQWQGRESAASQVRQMLYGRGADGSHGNISGTGVSLSAAVALPLRMSELLLIRRHFARHAAVGSPQTRRRAQTWPWQEAGPGPDPASTEMHVGFLVAAGSPPPPRIASASTRVYCYSFERGPLPASVQDASHGAPLSSQPRRLKRREFKSVCDVLVDALQQPVQSLAELIAVQHRLQVLVDLSMEPSAAILQLLALRPAPVQVLNGQKGALSLGNPLIAQYILTTRALLPPSMASSFTEKPVWLGVPCGQPAPPPRVAPLPVERLGLVASGPAPARRRADTDRAAGSAQGAVPGPGAGGLLAGGLPGALVAGLLGTVGPDPVTWDVWMAVLRACPHAVLWLVHVPAAALSPLRDEAMARGVAPHRIVTSPWTTLGAFPSSSPHESLLDGEEPPSLPAMLAHADFALSPPGSSAAAGGGDAAGTEEVRQALLAGLPVLTLAADRPASRGPFSETTALGAGLALQMAASTFREYESKAIGLAKKGDELKALRAQIQQSHSDECIEKSSEECSTPQQQRDPPQRQHGQRRQQQRG
ncbi:hypothetical protein CYMTET_14937, partial [Cymbomonas tetramitiformis]